MNSLQERCQPVVDFGYTLRESEFLYLVAAHSGFFTQRHFATYIGIAGRGPVTDFIKKAQAKKHIREYRPEIASQKVYHLFARTVYSAIGKENSRNRKTGRYGLLDKPYVRMLTLEFVLANSTLQYLEEEKDKIEYFTNQKQISLEFLPSRTFGQAGPDSQKRYFVERFPIFLSTQGNLPAIGFTYVEDEIRSMQTFGSFLERYRPLLERVSYSNDLDAYAYGSLISSHF